MPVDSQGVRADLIMDGMARIKRMNSGGLYEQYINATSHYVTEQVRGMMKSEDPAEHQRAWEYLKGYYEIVSPAFHQILTGPRYKLTPRDHLKSIVEKGIYLFMPTNNVRTGPEIIQLLRKHYPIPIGPVRYRGQSGHFVETTRNVLIGSLYIILLEKTGIYDWMGVSSAKLQHLGIPTKMTQRDRYLMPGRVNPVRNLGESETRLVAAITEDGVLSQMLESSNNPVVHKEITNSIIEAPNPTNIISAWDKENIPEGGNRAIEFVKHELMCAGIRLVNVDGSLEDGAIYTGETAVEDNEFDLDDSDITKD